MFPRHQLGLAHQGAGTFISHVGHRNQGALLVLGALANQNTVGGQRVESRSSLDPLALASRVREKGPRWLSFEQRDAVDELRAFGLRDPQLKPQVPIRQRRSSAEPVAGGFCSRHPLSSTRAACRRLCARLDIRIHRSRIHEYRS